MKKQMLFLSFLLAGILLFSACGLSSSGRITAKESRNAAMSTNARNQKVQEDEQSTADLPKADETYYMVIKNDLQNYQLTLMKLSNAEQICYEYTDGTEFFDKYGNYTPAREFSEGKLAVIRRLNNNDTLGAIAFTDNTWDYENIRNYFVDMEKKRLDIAGTSYQLDTFYKVFSEGVETEISAVGDSDILNVYGIDRTVYAIVVETGHGTLALTNTDLFEGGWVNLGTKVYAKVTKDMVMELPEGIYEFSVANDGYGDSGEVRIRRDKTTTIDLNDYKGEGPKLCKVTFHVGVKGAILTVNGEKINHTKPLELRYGVYTLGVYAKGYDTWTKQLVINSPKANIEIVLTEDSNTSSEANSGSDTGSEGKNVASNPSSNTDASSGSNQGLAGSKAGSLAGSHSGSDSSSNTGNTNNSASSALANAALGSSLASIITGGDSTDYLDTLSDLVDSLDKLNRSSSNHTD